MEPVYYFMGALFTLAASMFGAWQVARSGARKQSRDDLKEYTAKLEADLEKARAETAQVNTERRADADSCKAQLAVLTSAHEVTTSEVSTLKTDLAALRAVQTENSDLRARNTVLVDRMVDMMLSQRLATISHAPAPPAPVAPPAVTPVVLQVTPAVIASEPGTTMTVETPTPEKGR